MDEFEGFPWDGAKFSDDRTYRYKLWRTWEPLKTRVVFIGLNPSIAGSVANDPTITRLCNFSKKWGFGGLRMLNLYALVSTDPKRLTKHGSPIGPENDYRIKAECCRYSLTVVCWGSNKMATQRAEILIPKLREWCPNLRCFGRTKKSKWFPEGAPKHPLFLRASTQLQDF